MQKDFFLQDALGNVFFHKHGKTRISAWAVYALVALCLAYFQFRKKETTQISATLKPLFAQAMDGRWGQVIDSLTIFATVAGVSASLGLGAAQINSGLSYLFGLPEGRGVQLMIVAVIKELAYEKKEMGLYIKAEQFSAPDAPYRSYERDTEQEDEDEFEDADR